MKVDIANYYSLDQKVVTRLLEQEAQMAYQDQLVHETHEKRNELESYVYEMRNKINDKYAKYMSPEAKTNLLQQLDGVENWLYGEGAKTTKAAYAEKLEELKKYVGGTENKYRDDKEIPEYLGQFKKVLNNFEAIAFSKVIDMFDHLQLSE